MSKGFWSQLQTGDMRRNSEYYWDMVFECIYILVSAAHSEDHQEFSMPSHLKRLQKDSPFSGLAITKMEKLSKNPLHSFFYGNLDMGPEAPVPLQPPAMKNHQQRRFN